MKYVYAAIAAIVIAAIQGHFRHQLTDFQEYILVGLFFALPMLIIRQGSKR